MFNLTTAQKLELKMYCYHSGAKQLAVNTIHIEVAVIGPNPNQITSQDYVSAFSEAVAPFYKGVLDSSARFMGCSVQDFPQRIYIADWSIVGAGDGTVVGNDVPTQCSGLISLRTNFAKRTGRGRLYIPFPSATSNGADGRPISAYMTALDQLAEFIEGPIALLVGPDDVSVTSYPIICGKTLGDGPLKRITVANGVPKWATQRRRGAYGRLNEAPTPLI